MLHDDNYYYDIIRHNIKKYREIKGLTQQQLADRASVSMNYIAKIEVKKCKEGLQLLY